MTDVLTPSPAEAEAGERPATGTGSTGRRARRSLPTIDLALVQAALGLAVAVACAAIVFFQLHPRLLLSPTTPAGGDMGAHVWGPAYLRDHLLPQGRLTGWTPDWYAGFPAYHFYMLVPSLAIIVLNAGFPTWAGLAVTVALLIVAWGVLSAKPWRRRWLLAVAPVLALALVALPYGTAFKLVSVSGVVAFPVAAWLMGRMSRAPEPVPALLAAGTLPFLFDTNFSIYGGNIASTLAGEFAFSIGLCVGLLAIGFVKRGLDTGRRRVGAALLLALVALCHLIPLFFVVVACVLLVGLGRDLNRAWWVVLGLAAALAPVGLAPDAGPWMRALSPVPMIAVVALLLITSGEIRRRAVWLISAGVPAVLLASFWMVPFVVREPFMNDMGWERLEAVGAALLTPPMRIALPLAAVGYALALAFRDRLGVLLGTLVLVSASATANVPDTRLWNARLLPFFYLTVYLLAAVAVGLLIRAAAIVESRSADRPQRTVLLATPLVAFAAIVAAVAMPLRAPLPFAELTADGTYRWLAFENENASFIPSWASWNYSGYERKDAYREYHGIVSTMDQVGQDRGCGRAMWEYGPGLDRYGTPMALMLLPHWTDGCIGSMEGLFFESSQTTPFHFLNQSALSESPSRAQRDLPYVDFAGGASVDLGVRQLQTMGVRYYLALSDAAIAAAREHPELTEVAEAAPWVVFEVADAELVAPVTNLPVVVEGASIVNPVHGDRFRAGWLGEAVSSFNAVDPPVDALPAEAGPEGWPRAAGLADAPAVPAPPVAVSDISMGRDELSFRVDQVGVPVLVKVSYFPNWEASGAEGPWRAGPNLMVVVPTDNQVTLSYGNTWVEWLGWFLTASGVAALVALWRMDRRRHSAAPAPDTSDRETPAPAPLPVPASAAAADARRDVGDGGGS